MRQEGVDPDILPGRDAAKVRLITIALLHTYDKNRSNTKPPICPRFTILFTLIPV
jgi:hypothetical protein